MIWSCRRIPCPCASSKAQDAAECWCYLADPFKGEPMQAAFVLCCVRCNAEMRKTSPGVPVASGIHEGELADKNDPRG